MDAEFWRQKWQKNEIAFHASNANPLLVKHFNRLSLEKGSRVFLPLCGKTLDIAWLLSNGFRVAGAELVEMAILQLFDELRLKPEIREAGKLKRFSAENIDIFAGNIFDLSGKTLGPVDAVYDRAALVALPKEIRVRYTAHLLNLTLKKPQLVICYEYDQSRVEGPPFSITAEEINRHYRENYDLSLLESVEVPGGLRGGLCTAKENIWLLK
jgi:thiopurine S-methyltransferase